MKKFKQITILETIATANELSNNLLCYSENKIKYFDSVPENDNEIIKRIGNADCLLVTWGSKISNNVIENTNLKYIGLCATLYKGKNSNIDLEAAKDKDVIVKGISDYGDYGTVEFIISEIIRYFKKGTNRELKGKDIGIIGMGSVGSKLLEALNFFGANVYYYNKSRKLDLENINVSYLTKDELLKKTEVLVLCLPRNTIGLNKEDFENLDVNLLINISMGPPFKLDNFYNWVKQAGKYAIFDQIGVGDVESGKNIIVKDFVSGFTEEAKIRQVEKIVVNIAEFLDNK